MRHFPRFFVPAVLILAPLAPIPAHAAWTHDPSANLTVCKAAGDQLNVTMAPDGQGRLDAEGKRITERFARVE
jgi:hypothetical protein